MDRKVMKLHWGRLLVPFVLLGTCSMVARAQVQVGPAPKGDAAYRSCAGYPRSRAPLPQSYISASTQGRERYRGLFES